MGSLSLPAGGYLVSLHALHPLLQPSVLAEARPVYAA
jgi:hypothetical protein